MEYLTPDLDLDLDELEQRAQSSRSGVMHEGDAMYFGVFIEGRVLLELVRRARALEAIEQGALGREDDDDE